VNRFDSPEKVKSFIKEFHLTMPVAIDGQGSNDCDVAYGIEGSPTQVVIAPSGAVAAVIEGSDEEALLRSVTKLGYRP